MNDKTKIIGIFYIVFGALGILGLPMIYVHKLLMNSIFAGLADLDVEAQAMVGLFRDLMDVLIPAMVVLVVAHIVFNVLVGICFIKHKAYRTCFITAILTCFFFPFGTVLGIFALMALTDEDIKKLFAGQTM